MVNKIILILLCFVYINIAFSNPCKCDISIKDSNGRYFNIYRENGTWYLRTIGVKEDTIHPIVYDSLADNELILEFENSQDQELLKYSIVYKSNEFKEYYVAININPYIEKYNKISFKDDLYFCVSKYEVENKCNSGYREFIKKISSIKNINNCQFVATGYASKDSNLPSETRFDQLLSQQRAKALQEWLTEQIGIPLTWREVKGAGQLGDLKDPEEVKATYRKVSLVGYCPENDLNPHLTEEIAP